MKLQLKSIAEEIFEDAKKEFEKISKTCKLVIVTVGDDPASITYVNNKIKKCKQMPNVECDWVKLEESIGQKELNDIIQDLSLDASVSGILLQQPLPFHLDSQKALAYLYYRKDVDGITPSNKRFLLSGEIEESIVPCTALGIKMFLEKFDYSIAGKTFLVIGRSDLVGRPLIALLENANATVIWANSYTPHSVLRNLAHQATCIISAVGKPNFITDEHVNPAHLHGQLFIDVGINRDIDNKMVGDCNITNSTVCDVTAVPGGVGQLTTSALMHNLLKCHVFLNREENI